MSTVKIGADHRITIPQDILQKLHLQPGDCLDVQIHEGRITLVPTKKIPKGEEWFWTKEWQAMEAEAERDLQEGRYKDFDNVGDLIADLNRKRS